MGLLSEVYEFLPIAPPYNLIWREISEIAGTEVPGEIWTVPPNPYPPLSPKQQAGLDNFLAKRKKSNNRRPVTPTTTGILFANERLHHHDAGRTYLHLNRSIDGTKIILMGNSQRLFTSACKALDELGGRVHQRTH